VLPAVVVTIPIVGWDASRPVPWNRLLKEWLIYAAILAVVFALVFRGSVFSIVAGLVVSGPIYLAFGYVMAKFGYQRKSLADLRTPRATTAPEPEARRAPAPTRRTSGGRNRRPPPGRKRR
jgi:hypothetical protein